MATITRTHLSGGNANGRPIPIVLTSSPGTTIHTVATATNIIDHVYLFYSDILTTATKDFTLEAGGTATTDAMLMTLAGKAKPNCILDGLPFQGGATLVLRGFAATATHGILVGGWVDRHTA